MYQSYVSLAAKSLFKVTVPRSTNQLLLLINPASPSSNCYIPCDDSISVICYKLGWLSGYIESAKNGKRLNSNFCPSHDLQFHMLLQFVIGLYKMSSELLLELLTRSIQIVCLTASVRMWVSTHTYTFYTFWYKCYTLFVFQTWRKSLNICYYPSLLWGVCVSRRAPSSCRLALIRAGTLNIWGSTQRGSELRWWRFRCPYVLLPFCRWMCF